MRPLIAANWKMHARPADRTPYRPNPDMDIVVFPTFLELHDCVRDGLVTGAQWGHAEDSGAHTGDVSMAMIAGAGALYVLCGHSERRKYHGETDAMIAAQVASALRNGLHPILCVGETEDERSAGKEKQVVERQLKGMPGGITIAYEPVWAIGTGKTATPADAGAMHAFIRSHLKDGAEARILYGGSLTAANADKLFAQEEIDGALVGGASLKPEEFAKIVAAAKAAL